MLLFFVLCRLQTPPLLLDSLAGARLHEASFEVLVENPLVCREWRTFARALGLSEPLIRALESEARSSLPSDEKRLAAAHVSARKSRARAAPPVAPAHKLLGAAAARASLARRLLLFCLPSSLPAFVGGAISWRMASNSE